MENQQDLLKELENFSKENLNHTEPIFISDPVVPGSQFDRDNSPTSDEITEYFDSPEDLKKKASEFAKLLKKSKHFVVHTGAGISTAASIPDYRGPQGVWTLKAQGKTPKMNITIEEAQPTYSHMALVTLMEKGYLKFLISTNCDGLHIRSGISDEKLAELHGGIYREYCVKCKAEYIRSFDVRKSRVQFIQTKRFTGRLCSKIINGEQCRGRLRDSIVNFGEYLPERSLTVAQNESMKADLVLVIGSSMRVEPSASLPRLSGDLCICNLQKTPVDKSCKLRIFSKSDEFLKFVMEELGLEVKTWTPFPFGDEEIIQDEENQNSIMEKYNVHSMSDDGPPPEAVLEQIRSGFVFKRHIIPNVKQTLSK